MKKLNSREQIIRYLASYHRENGYPPTVREICTAVGLNSPATVHAHLRRLEMDGVLKKDPNKQRTYILNARYAGVGRDVPLLGKVAAGQPILAYENQEDAFPLPPIFSAGGDSEGVFMLTIQGDSMTGAGIYAHDVVAVQPMHEIHNGDIVIARVQEDGFTVKRYFKKGNTVTLQAENPDYAPINVDVREVEVMGKVIGLMRAY
ncbi:MAG: transcriptional repressor LexA [Clostridiales bacterium]|nr:transcriptional repressor LexA [Clostridiales bacterium]